MFRVKVSMNISATYLLPSELDQLSVSTARRAAECEQIAQLLLNPAKRVCARKHATWRGHQRVSSLS